MPLSKPMQDEVVQRRLGESDGKAVVAYVQRQLKREEYLEMAQNALMLSLLISILGRAHARLLGIVAHLTLLRVRLRGGERRAASVRVLVSASAGTGVAQNWG